MDKEHREMAGGVGGHTAAIVTELDKKSRLDV